MNKFSKIPLGIKIIITFHILNVVMWTFGQGYAVIDYDTVAEWGLQDPRELIDPVIVEVNRGIGLTDMIIMMPLFIAGIIGLWRMKFYGAVISWMVFGITIYWPVVFWSSQFFYGQAGIKYKPTSAETIIVPAVIILIALWASWYLYKNREIFK